MKAHNYNENDITVKVGTSTYKYEFNTLYVLRVECIKGSLKLRWHIARMLAGCKLVEMAKARNLLMV